MPISVVQCNCLIHPLFPFYKNISLCTSTPQCFSSNSSLMFVQAVEEFLGKVRSKEQPHSAGLVSQPTAVKFLMARKFDVSRAIELFQAYKVQQHLDWRWNLDCYLLFVPTAGCQRAYLGQKNQNRSAKTCNHFVELFVMYFVTYVNAVRRHVPRFLKLYLIYWWRVKITTKCGNKITELKAAPV